MVWENEIESDYQHQLFYRKALDKLEDEWQKHWKDYLNTHWLDPSIMVKARRYERAKKNYRLVKKRYDHERFTRRWGH